MVRKAEFKWYSVGLLLLLVAAPLNAQTSLAKSERFYLSLGYYDVFRAESSLSYVRRGLGAGLALSPTDTFGLNLESSVVKVEGHYRLSSQSQIGFSWYRIESDAIKVVEAEVDWVNQEGQQIAIAAGSEIASSLLYDIMKVSYDWSFYHSDKVELSVGGGFHISRFEVNLEVNADANGNPVSQDARNVAHTVPLPTIGVGLHYRLTKKWFWYLKTEGFYLKYNDWDGLYSETELGIEYSITRNIGLGLGLSSDNLSVTETTDEHRFRYDNRFSGLNFYLSWSLY